jgi:hypothetical protein
MPIKRQPQDFVSFKVVYTHRDESSNRYKLMFRFCKEVVSYGKAV